MKITHLIYILFFIIPCLNCTSDKKETNPYEKLNVGVIRKSSKIAFSPNLEEVLCIVPNIDANLYGESWSYLYSLKDLSLLDTCFVPNNFILSWKNDTIALEDFIIEEEILKKIDASKKSLSSYSINCSRTIRDSFSYIPSATIRFGSLPSTIFSSYKIDIAKDELLFLGEETKDSIRLSFKEYSNDFWNQEKTLEMNGMLKKIKYREYYLFKRHESYIEPSSPQLLNQFYKDLFQAISKVKEAR